MYISKFKKYKLIKNNIYVGCKYKSCIHREKLNPFLKQNYNILKNFDDKFIEYINIFLNTLQAKNPSIDLNLFYNNLINLSIKERKNFNRCMFFKTYTKGIYKYKDNKIEVLKDDYPFSIFHELLHCSSAKKEQNCFSIGFAKEYKKFSIGSALNEGYTTLLEERYFNDNFRKNDYENLKYIAKTIELLIGKDEMEKFYFTSDLNGLIKEFEKYGANKRQIMFFLDELDYILCNLGFYETIGSCQTAIDDVVHFLINCYKKKDPSKLNEYINNFNKKIKVCNITYNFSNIDSKHKIEQYFINEIEYFKKH